MSTPDCCKRTPGNREKHDSPSNDTLDTFWGESDDSVDYDGDSEVSKQKNRSLEDFFTQTRYDLNRSLDDFFMQAGKDSESLQNDEDEDEESSLGASLTTNNTVAESVILVTLAEKTAQEMKEIIDWYETPKSLPQRQCLAHNSLVQLNLRDDDDEDESDTPQSEAMEDSTTPTTLLLMEPPSVESSSTGESSSRTSTTTPKQAVQKLPSGTQEALTQAKR
jgi:hypothetical protein